MKCKKIFLNILLFCLVFICGCTQNENQSITANKITDKDKAILLANEIYTQEKAKGIDLSSGPCIANPIPQMPDWVIDIAHNPRQAIDNLAENQCSVFREGKASHFIELDLQGKV